MAAVWKQYGDHLRASLKQYGNNTALILIQIKAVYINKMEVYEALGNHLVYKEFE